MIQEENPTLVLGFNETRDDKNLVMDESSNKPPNLLFTSQDPHIEETMEVRI